MSHKISKSISVSIMSACLIGQSFLAVNPLLLPASAANKKVAAPSAAMLIDTKSFDLINTGDWSKLADRLQTLSQSDSTVTRNHAWLAFAYLFLSRCPELQTLDQKCQGMPKNDSDPLALQLVHVFNLTCQSKYDDAEKALTAISNGQNDVLYNLALAAVAVKKGRAQDGAVFCQKVIELAPDFAWVYRTLAFIEDKSLHNSDKADADYQKALAIQPDFNEARDLLINLRLSKSDFDGAIDIAQAAIKKNPHDGNNYYRLALILVQQSRLKEAIAQLDKAASLSPGNSKLHRTLATIYLRQKLLNEAIAEQQKAVDLSQDKGFELIELSNLNELAGNANKAIENLQAAIALAPSNQSASQKLAELLIKEKRYDDLIKEYKRIIALNPKLIDARIGLAAALEASGKQDEAINELKEAANADSTDPRAHRALGAIYIRQKNFHEASKSYTRALNINPSSVEDLVALGYCYAENNDYMPAETAFVTALALQQLTQSTGGSSTINRYDVMRSLAALLLIEGRYSDATVNMEAVNAANKELIGNDKVLLLTCRALRDRNSVSLKELTEFYNSLPDKAKADQRAPFIDTLLKLGKAQLALELINQVSAEEEKNDIDWAIFRARAYRLLGNGAKAEEIAQAATQSSEPDGEKKSDAYSELAFALLLQDKLDAAATATIKAIELNAKSFNALEVKARIEFKRKAYDQALASAKRALEINPYDASAYALQGNIYMAMGAVNNSKDAYNKAVESYKKSVELYPALVDTHIALKDAYTKLALNEDIENETAIITDLNKKNQ